MPCLLMGNSILSSVLNSEIAIQMNIQIIRRFVHLRAVLETQKHIVSQLNKHEIKLLKHDRQFEEVFAAFDSMREAPELTRKKKIGFG
jgi:hypothetical protein